MPRNPPLQSASQALGGLSEWLKEMDCKSIGSAYAGSNPAPPTTGLRAGKYADVAQLVEHLHGKEGVRGSSPLVGFRRWRLGRCRHRHGLDRRATRLMVQQLVNVRLKD